MPELTATSGVHGLLRQVATVDHQGTVIAFARAATGPDLFYNVLDLKVSTAVDNLEWTGFVKLDVPTQLRPAGSGIVTVGDTNGTILAVAEAPLVLVSDEKYLYLLQQSSRGTVLLNRFMFKRAVPAGGGVAVPVLEPVWEVRFQRSGKEDIPDGPRDTQGYTAPDGTPFIEPTIELPMIKNLTDGRFDALILPNQSGTGTRWQFVAVNAPNGTLDLFSFPADENGLPDLAGVKLAEGGTIDPDATIALTLDQDGAQIPLDLAGRPSATLYTLRERVKATSGSDLLLKRSARVMLAQPVRRTDGALQIATLDLALGTGGRLARLPETTSASLVQPANDALQFANAAYLQLPASPALALKGSYRAEFWLYPSSAVTTDQYIFRGDPANGAANAAAYVMITRDLRVATGFGTGSDAVSASTTAAVITPGQWVHVQVSYDTAAARGNFTVLVNGRPVAVTGADNTALPAGQPITTISGSHDGIVGILDGLRLWDVSSGTAVPVGDWPFDQIDYDASPPITPDQSTNHNDAAVHGAVLVSSTAPISTDTAGTLYVDADGLASYAGVLSFAEPGGSPSLFTGSDGLVHLYYAGLPDGDRDGLFCVAQYDAESARAVWQSGWTATAGPAAQTGTLQLTAARSGTFMNAATITIQPADGAALCTVGIDDGHGRVETWRGVPRSLDRFVAVLNGTATSDLFTPLFRSGGATFYDCTGSYAQSQMAVSSPDTSSVLSVLSRFPAVMQLASAGIDTVTDTTCTVRLTFTVPQWTGAPTVTQSWPEVSVFAATFLQQLGGIAPGYDYSDTTSASASVHGLATVDAANTTHDLLLLTPAGVADLKVAIEAGSRSDRCTIQLSLDANGPKTVELRDISRDQVAVAAAINASTLSLYVLAVTDGLSAAALDQPAATPPVRDLRAWAFLIAAFAEERLAPNARVTQQDPVPAAILQSAQLASGGKTTTLSAGSTLVRALAASEPSNGGVALVDNTTGPATLSTAAINGGWVRVSPHKAIAVNGANGVVWDMAAPTSETLALPGDITVEAWCKPAGATPAGARPRLVGYHRAGSPDFPDQPIQWALGLQPAPSLNFTDSTAINGSYDLDGTDCTPAAVGVPDWHRRLGPAHAAGHGRRQPAVSDPERQ
ncbi:LamG-like jellyroll fold domain-containing protein [Leekyejoonella antrihumi]|uniref:LamG-like jellyroll fold domain-containing protein n=1 Tax=Leekyejoonella antrihumi TaxID=1660198 RepID=UPI0016449182|nr:LamG-like jellyroll fold domain-containing protein [Leekyejoonella antrihumi]